MKKDLLAAAVQFKHEPGAVAANLATVERFARAAAVQGVDLLAFPEMCLTGYWHVRKLDRDGVAALAEPVPSGPLSRRLLALARETGITLGAGLIEAGADGRFYNSYLVAMPDGSHACHRKLHAFISEHISNGDQFTVFDIPQGARVGVLICYDCNLDENVRINALRGAEILLAPHQTGGCVTPSPGTMGRVPVALWEEREMNPWAIEAEFRGPKGREWLHRWLPARAHDNGLFVVFSNGVGRDDDEVRTGNAMILDPYGNVLAETWRARDEMVVASLQASRLENCLGRRWIESRRPELYGELAQPTGRERATREVRFKGLAGDAAGH